MVYILRSSAQFEPQELINLLKDKPNLLHPRVRFLQGPFPIQNLGNLDLLGLDDQGGWVLVKVAEHVDAKVLLDTLSQVAWVRDHAAWITTLPSYDVSDPQSMPAVFLVGSHFGNSLGDMLGFLQGVSVGLMRYSAFDMGDQKAVHFEPLFREGGVEAAEPSGVPASDPVPHTMPTGASSSAPPVDTNLSLLQPLTDEEIAEFLPTDGKDRIS